MWTASFWFGLFLIIGGVSAAAAVTIGRKTLWRSEGAYFASWRGGDGSMITAGKKTKTTTSVPKDGPLQIFTKTVLDARRHLAAAAVARSTSIFVMYPIDAIKTRLQMRLPDPYRLDGIFNGVGGSLIGQVPYGVLTFGSYEMYKQTLLSKFSGQIRPVFLYAAAAVLGDLTGSGWLCPSEVIKQKVQAGMFASTSQAISEIWKTKGLVGFYEGYFGGIARDVPFRVAQLTTFEVTKNLFLRIKERRQSEKNQKTDDNIQLSPVEAAIVGAVAGSFSAAITAPLDRIKTLLMTDSAKYGGTVISCATKVIHDEGMQGLMTGVVPRVIYIAPSVVIFFVAYEMTQQKLQHWQTSPATQVTKQK
jgi:solute carrier family 25 S-adenosylmethionine transporter 26